MTTQEPVRTIAIGEIEGSKLEGTDLSGRRRGPVRARPSLEPAMAVREVSQGLVVLHRARRFTLSRPAFTALCLRSAARIYLEGDAS